MTERDIFLDALDVPPADRPALLAARCGTDEPLRRRVEALLAAHAAAERFLEQPAAAEADTFTHRRPPDQPTGVHAPADPEPDRVGEVLAGRYKLLERIGEGGMGSVWMAEQTEPVKRKVAVKLIRSGLDSRAVLARFEAERQALAVMDHPNIARVLDGGQAPDGRPFFVMELVKGVPITEFCDQRQLTPRQRLELFVPVCQAIQHAHQKGVIHRDIKPSNVLVALYDDRPVPKVIDFGVAKAAGQTLTDKTLHTGFGAVVGTPEYMSPEQASFNNLDIDTRSDVYSLGVLLYELLTGGPPFSLKELQRAGLLEMLRVVREEEPPRPSARLSTSATLPALAADRGTEPARLAGLVRGEVDWIVMKALEKDRGRRYETANGFAADVQRYLNGEAVQAHPPTAGYRLKKFVKRHRSRVATGVLLVLVLATGVAGTVWQLTERRREREAIRSQARQTAVSAADRAEAALVANRLSEVEAALAAIDPEQLRTHVGELQPRIDLIRNDLAAHRELEAIYEEYWTVCPSNTTRDPEKAKARYPDLFRRYGIPVGELSAADAAARVRASLIAPALTDGLATWFFLAPNVDGLRPLLDRLDPDEFRVTVRAAVAAGNMGRLREFAVTADPSQHPPIFSVMLAGTVSDPESYRILTAAWRRHPDSFAVVLALAFPEPGVSEARAKERVGWSRMAIALRPNNALAHYYFGIEHFWETPAEDGIRTFRRAIELAPRFANAHAQLGNQFKRLKRYEEALAAYRRATEIDPDNVVGHAGQANVYLFQKDWVMASRHMRVLERLAEPDNDFCQSSIASASVHGALGVLSQRLAKGLVHLRQFHELARLGQAVPGLQFCHGHPDDGDEGDSRLNIGRYLPACAAVRAAAGDGIDPPPPADRPVVRRLALDWLTDDLEACHLTLCEDEALGPLVHATMTRWLAEPMLADVRGGRTASLPPAEQGGWRDFWLAVEGLRDQTAPPPKEVAPPPRPVR